MALKNIAKAKTARVSWKVWRAFGHSTSLSSRQLFRKYLSSSTLARNLPTARAGRVLNGFSTNRNGRRSVTIIVPSARNGLLITRVIARSLRCLGALALEALAFWRTVSAGFGCLTCRVDAVGLGDFFVANAALLANMMY